MNYIYTARATGRVQVELPDGSIVYAFPMKYAYKPSFSNYHWTIKQSRQADRQAERVQKHPDWSGYVIAYDNELWRCIDPVWSDDTNLGMYVGDMKRIDGKWIVERFRP